MRFYIKYDSHQDGPFDLITMIRKIRSGELRQDILVLEDSDDRAVAAGAHPRLQSFYMEMEDDYIPDTIEPYMQNDGIFYTLQQGWRFFQQHPNSVACSGIYLLSILGFGIFYSAILPDVLGVFGLLLTWVTAYFLLGGFLISLLQMYRGERPQLAYILSLYKQHYAPLLAYATIIGLLSALGGMLLIIPGLIVLTLFIFAPLLIIEQNLPVRNALEASSQTVKRHGRKMFEILFTLIALNFIAALFFIFPLLVTLPISMVIIIELYERIAFRE